MQKFLDLIEDSFYYILIVVGSSIGAFELGFTIGLLWLLF